MKAIETHSVAGHVCVGSLTHYQPFPCSVLYFGEQGSLAAGLWEDSASGALVGAWQ